MASRVYTQLAQRVLFLEVNLLPPERDDGEYSQIEVDKIKSFILLCSAEFEEYLEARLTELNSRSQRALKRGRIPKSAASVITHIELKRDGINKKSIIEFSIECFQHANKMIGKNHGYQQSKIEKLFKSHGFEEINAHSALLSTLDKYGKVRGEIAHRSGLHQTNVTDPKIVKTDVSQIISDLAILDEEITNFARSLR